LSLAREEVMKLRGHQRFRLETVLASRGLPHTIAKFQTGAVIFSQGDAADTVMYVERGRVKKSVRSKVGSEAIVALLRPGDFFGEGCLTGQRVRRKTAVAITPSTVLAIDKAAMGRLLHTSPTLTDRFMAHLLRRNVQIEEDLVDQLMSTAEQRLARTLLGLARYGTGSSSKTIRPTISQTTLAGLVGTTRPRINRLLKKLETRGFIDRTRGLTVHRSLLSVVSHD
jgi:CRP-like cAMP-binding protein